LYGIQVRAEFQKVLGHAAALKQAHARFVSVDYVGNIAPLKEIHEAAGGRAEDLVMATPPSSVISKLHALGLLSLPGVAAQKPQRFEKDPKSFETSFTV